MGWLRLSLQCEWEKELMRDTGIKSDMFASNAWRYIPGGSPDWPAEKIEGMMASHCPLGRCAVPEDVARVVGFLCSEDGGWVNGQIITISGGSGQ